MKKLLIYLQMLLYCGIIFFTSFACSNDENKEKIQNNDKLQKEQIIGRWDVVAVGVMSGTKETSIDQEIEYWKVQASDADYLEVLKDIKDQYENMMKISFDSNNSIHVTYEGDALQDEQGAWIITDVGQCHVKYGNGVFAVDSDLIVNENGEVFFYVQKELLKIYIEKVDN